MLESVTIKIGGEAGFGIMAAGTMLARAFSRAGYHVFATNEYPSLIRGGHNLVTVRIATTPFASMNFDVHILVALNRETVNLHKSELDNDSIVLYDSRDGVIDAKEFSKPVQLIPLALTELVRAQNGELVMRNTVSLGAVMALVGAEFALLAAVIQDQFKKKGEEVIAQNIAIGKTGYDAINNMSPSVGSVGLSQPSEKRDYVLLNGSEILGVGAVRAGLKFAAIYPMTPINSLITYLADHAASYGIVYKQPEDEIAGINMAIGASVAGVRSMVATSGGGFALMVEGVSLAGMIEVPIVIDLGMRVGPATGMPTWTEQGELQFAIHAGHGEFARIVLAPGDAEETYRLTILAFNLADRYHIPVFLLTDKYLNESQWCMSTSILKEPVSIDRGKLIMDTTLPSDYSFHRYELNSSDGVSPRSVPGTPFGQYIANSYEHDGHGYVTEEADKRMQMVDKRLRKLNTISHELLPPILYGAEGADITFVTWGSSKGPLLEAVHSTQFTVNRKNVNVVQFPWLFPFPTEATIKLLGSAKRIIDVEQNATGQLASLIREYTGIEIKEKLLKYDGRPFYPEEILEKVISNKQ